VVIGADFLYLPAVRVVLIDVPHDSVAFRASVTPVVAALAVVVPLLAVLFLIDKQYYNCLRFM
jgi:hypothetical protein